MTQEYWKDNISQREASGKSMAEFCRHEDISYWTFRDWKKRRTNISLNEPLQISIKGINLTIPERYDEQYLIKLISTLRKLP